jgi:hypothetical protein
VQGRRGGGGGAGLQLLGLLTAWYAIMLLAAAGVQELLQMGRGPGASMPAPA